MTGSSTEQCSVDDLVDVLCGWETVDTRMVSPDRAEQLDIELAGPVEILVEKHTE